MRVPGPHICVCCTPSWCLVRSLRVRLPSKLAGVLLFGVRTFIHPSATIDYWEYNDAVRRTADPVCVAHLMTAVQVIDDVLSTRVLTGALKSWFGLRGLESDQVRKVRATG